jgi:hypothetical protein
MNTENINLVKAHLQMWSEPSHTKRLVLANEIYAANIEVIDPEVILNGRIEVSDFIGNLLNQYPGFQFTIAKPIETHHNRAILSWQFGPTTKPDTITGQDIFTISEGYIASFLVFVDGVTK